MKKPLSYNETLSIVENFMLKSGIRRYCAEMCYGQCCAGCYENEKAVLNKFKLWIKKYLGG